MLFNYRDLKDITHQLEYIDTVLIPVIDVDYRGRLMDIVDKYEIIQYVTMGAENQFKGRVLLAPPVQIQEDSTTAHVIAEQLKSFGMKNVLYVTPQSVQIDSSFPQFKVDIFPLSTMDDEMRHEMVQTQVKSLMKTIIALWNK